MATVTTTLVPPPIPFAYAGFPDVYLPDTSHAAGDIRFQAFDQAIDLSGVGDNQALVVNMDLPSDYSYVLVDLTFGISSGTAATTNNWPLQMDCHLQDSVTGHVFESWIALDSAGICLSASDRENLIYSAPRLPTPVVVAVPGSMVRLQIQSFNETANDQAYLAHVFARFMRYTVVQATHYAVNTPIPVR